MTGARLVLEPVEENDRKLRLSAHLIEPDGFNQKLWWELPAAWGGAITTWADPWVAGFVFPMMQRARAVHVEGRVSPSLLTNIAHFMKMWANWAPGKYHVVAVTADQEVELPPVENEGLTVASFSCGVDSSFMVFRHANGPKEGQTRRLEAGVLQHGFDVLLDQENSEGIYQGMLADGTAMLRSLDLSCIPLANNFHELRVDWGDAWGSQLVSGLSLLAGRYDTALIADDWPPISQLKFSWATHPHAIVLLGSRRFKVVNDCGEFTRVEKARAISAWPDAMRYLRVCFGQDVPGKKLNCCRCEKCMRTILAFRIAGCARPFTFAHDVTDEQIRRVRFQSSDQEERWLDLSRAAGMAGLGRTSWARAILSALRRNQWRKTRNRLQRPFIPLRNVVRKWVRGTALSKSEIAAQ